MNIQEKFIALVFDDFTQIEEVSAFLIEFNPLGIVEGDDSWTCYFDSVRWSDGLAEVIRDMIRTHFPDMEMNELEVEQENWNLQWEKTIIPQKITDRISISPSWNIDPAAPINIIIDPKMSFGTGYHATTRLVLRLLEKYVRGNETALDVGTGTGVLAIAAVRLGAAHAVGVDNDEWSFINANENIEKNNLRDRITIVLGSLEQVHGTFDIIAANITKNDIIAMIGEMKQFSRATTLFLFSGILADDACEIEAEFQIHRLTLIDKIFEEEWVAYALRKDE